MQKQFVSSGAPHYRVIDESRIIQMMLAQGWAYEVHSDRALHAPSEARTVLERWINQGLPYAVTPAGDRRFDSADIIDYLVWSGHNQYDSAWEDHFVATGRRLVANVAPGPARFTIRFEREFNLAFSP